MIRFLILIGYFEWMLSLRLSGKLDQYINVHYQYLVTISMILAFFLACVQLTIWVKEGKKPTKFNLTKDRFIHACTHPFSNYPFYRQIGIYLLLALPLFVGYFFPTVTLDASIVQAKGFAFPQSKEATNEEGDIDIQYLKPNTQIFFSEDEYQNRMEKSLGEWRNQPSLSLNDDDFLSVSELIYQYPNAFVDKEVRFKGFVFHPSHADENSFFVFRFGILHCIADAGVFGFLCIPEEGVEMTDFTDNDWVEITGIIDQTHYTPFHQMIPSVRVTQIHKIPEPANPYVYYQFGS